MTCIVGIEHADGVTIGADSAGSDGWVVSRRADAKLFNVGPYLFGFCGSFRMGQLLRYSFTPPTVPKRSLDRFMTTEFVDSVRKCFKQGGFAERVDQVESGGTFLVGLSGRLYLIDSDYQVGSQIEGYDSIGSGNELALGSLHTTGRQGLEPALRTRLALAAAAEHNPFVSAPFKIRTLAK